MGEGDAGQPPALGQRETALVEGGQHAVVTGGVDHHGAGAVVLGGAADHRGPADVDLLDALRVGRARGHRLLEGIEVDHDELERVDLQLVELRHVVRLGEVGQQPGVHPRVQGLDPPVDTISTPAPSRALASSSSPDLSYTAINARRMAMRVTCFPLLMGCLCGRCVR